MKKGRYFEGFLILSVIILIAMSAFAIADTNSTNGTVDNTTLFTAPADTGTTGSTALTTTNFGTSASQSTAINNAYQCLRDEISNKTTDTLSLQEAVFGTLALGNVNVLQNKISDMEDGSNSCWPSGACTVKDTAQVMLAYQRTGQNTNNIENWLLSKNGTSTDLNWYLEMDISNANSSQCTIGYDTSQYTINVRDDMTLSGNAGSCFSISPNGYWLLFNPSCYGKQIDISCDQDFITALLYQKKAGTTIYVLPNTQSAAASGTTTESVNTQCFKSGANCDYEGSLWATLALQKSGVNVDSFVPYLIAMSDSYQQYFPSTFLYALTGANDQYSNIVQSQQQSRFWNTIGSPYNKYYDTSLAMMALSGSSSNELTNAQNYLTSIQGKDGCWNNNNIRDTAFLLYSGWPRAVSGGGGSGSPALCGSVAGQSCENSISCLNAGGSVLSAFQCSGFDICCSVTVSQQSCSTQNGALCASNQQCNGNVVQSSDSGTCCIGTCVNKALENTCTTSGGICRNTCNSDEQADSSQTCSDATQICCVQQQPISGGGTNWTWIIILIILIVLVVLAILFRNKIKIWWFKMRGKAKVSPVVRPRVPPGAGFSPRMPLRPAYRPMPPQYRPRPSPQKPLPARKPTSEKDKELEETLKKLREMSK